MRPPNTLDLVNKLIYVLGSEIMVMDVVYNPTLVLLSIAVAIFASYVALNLAHSVTEAQGRARLIWLACGALAMGVGIWSMHFVGMLAFEMPGMKMAYDVPLMTLSVVVAIVGSALALFVVSRPILPAGSLISAGIAMAAAINGMHYIGMYSMRMAARIEWNVYLVLLSILIALIASFAALTIAIRLRNKPERLLLLLSASTLMGFAISGMHYTGMFAATFIHDPTAQIEKSHLLVSSGLTITTVFTTLFILGIALISSVIQRVMTLRQKQSEKKYRLLVEAVKDYAIFMIDPKGFITTWNPGAKKITGYTEKEIIGKHLSIFYTADDVQTDFATKELEIAREHGHFEGEAIRLKKDGSKFWANIVVDPLYDQDGKLSGFSKVTRDVTQLKEAAARIQSINEELEKRVKDRTLELQHREAQLRTITNALPILVAQVDSNERFLFANDSFCSWFHRSQKEIQQLSFREVLGEDRYPANKPYIDQALAGKTVSYERKSYSEEKQAILNITFVPEFDDKKYVKGFIIVAADVSRYKEIEEELKNAKEQADVANETKSAFLANMSHEIRTPLGAVLGFSELLLDESMSSSERENAIEVIKRNGKLLSTIINDILDLSKVEAGKLEIEKIDIQTDDLLNEILALLNLEASGKGIQLNISYEGIVPSIIRTDPTRLRQILLNVIGNAIKFTKKGFVKLKVRLDPSDISKLQFVVQDTGVGIAPEHASRLFAPFMQADVTTTRHFGGTGLGLILSKKLAKVLGGDVRLVESTLDKGSTFIVSIDHGQAEEVISRSSNEPQKTGGKVLDFDTHQLTDNLSRLKVLVVDDSIDNLLLIAKILDLSGLKVETASSGKEGVKKAMNKDFDIVLMDLQMPGMDGYEATQQLRKLGFKHPIIALTAHAMKEERQRCLRSGFNDHMTKPIDRDVLFQMLSKYSA